MQINQIPFTETGYLNSLMVDYVSENKDLKSFYNRFPDVVSAGDQIKDKKEFSISRPVLVESLKEQYKNLSHFSHQEVV